jgi:hypothetical protein
LDSPIEFNADYKEHYIDADECVSFQDMDLIEVLWKQDVDLGFTLVDPPSKKPSTSEKESDEIEKLKVLKTINATGPKVRERLSF